MARRTRPPSSLNRARLLPPSRERAWLGDIVQFQIDELNALFDPLRRKGSAPEERQRVRDKARRRIEAVGQAAALEPEGYFEACWGLIRAGLDAPEDAFGAAILLVATRAERPEARAWLASLPASVADLLRELEVPVPR
jgi:hypothetical protein